MDPGFYRDDIVLRTIFMASIKAGNISKNDYILFKDTPHIVTKTEFHSPGKGSAFMKCKLKSIINGNTIEFTFKSNETVESVDVTSMELQFLYDDGESVVFMDPRTFDQAEVDRDLVEDKIGFLTPDMRCYVLFYQEKAIGVRLPTNVKLTVTESQDAVAGNTVNAPKKAVTVETGMEVMVPLFVKEGDVISVSTENGEYLGRVND